MKQKWAILILILSGIIAYANTAKNGLFWDDDEFITRNAYIRAFRYLPQWFSQPMTAGAGVNSNYYRPLLQLSLAIDYKLWGLWPAGYHLENLLWHTAAAILLYIFLKELLGKLLSKEDSPWRTPRTVLNISFAASLLWLVHPVHVEAVAYANSRGDSMAAVFILLSLVLWLRQRFWASAAAFVLALLSKEFAIVTPGLITLLEFIKVRPWRTPRSDLLRLSKRFVPHFVIAVIYLLLRLTVLNFQNTLNFYGVDLALTDQNQPLARYATSLSVRLMTFFKVLPIYAGILIWPNDLHMERTVEVATNTSDLEILFSLFAVSLIFIISILSFYKGLSFLRKDSPFQIIQLAAGWFFISILPVSGIIPISQILAEHFLYLPSIGFFLLVGLLIVTVSKMLKGRLNDSNHLTFMYVTYWTILLIISIPLLLKTIRQNRIWRDPITFYEYTLAHAEPTARVYNNLAMAYADVKENQKAINNYQLAISLGDVYPNPHYNMGNTLVEQGKLDEAEREYRRALEIDPQFHYATLKLGQVYLDRGKINDAKNLVCPVFPTQPLCQQL